MEEPASFDPLPLVHIDQFKSWAKVSDNKKTCVRKQQQTPGRKNSGQGTKPFTNVRMLCDSPQHSRQTLQLEALLEESNWSWETSIERQEAILRMHKYLCCVSQCCEGVKHNNLVKLCDQTKPTELWYGNSIHDNVLEHAKITKTVKTHNTSEYKTHPKTRTGSPIAAD